MRLIIPGPPVSQGRMRLSNFGGFARCYDPMAKQKKVIREQLAKYIHKEYVSPTFPRVSFIFHMPVPKSIRKRDAEAYNSGLLKHIVKPDCDNLAKLYLDCMDEIFFHGDQQVSLGFCIKLYHPEPKTIILINQTTEVLTPQEVDQDTWIFLGV